MHESQSKAWGFPGRELTKIIKKNTQNGLILKGEMGDSSSFHIDWLASRVSRGGLMSHCPYYLLGSRVLLGKSASVLKLILYGETGSEILSHSREVGFTWLWWT
jgi:hypothetical protein